MKDRTTILVPVIILVGSCQAHAILVDSNSIVQNGVQYYIQTDKSLYELGEDVEMLFTVTNLSDEPLTIPCTRSPELNLLVRDNGLDVWMKIHGWYMFSPGVPLAPGEYVDLTHTWNMTADNGELISPGIYHVVGVMYKSEMIEVAVPITIVPEPSSAVILIAGLIVFLRRTSS